MTNPLTLLGLPSVLPWDSTLEVDYLGLQIGVENDYSAYLQSLREPLLESLPPRRQLERVISRCVEGEFEIALEELRQVPPEATPGLAGLARMRLEAGLLLELGDSGSAVERLAQVQDALIAAQNLFPSSTAWDAALQSNRRTLLNQEFYHSGWDAQERVHGQAAFETWRGHPVLDHFRVHMLSGFSDAAYTTTLQPREGGFYSRGAWPPELAYFNAALAVAYLGGDIALAREVRQDWARQTALAERSRPDADALRLALLELWRAHNAKGLNEFLARYRDELVYYAELEVFLLEERPYSFRGKEAAEVYALLRVALRWLHLYLSDEALERLTDEFMAALGEALGLEASPPSPEPDWDALAVPEVAPDSPTERPTAGEPWTAPPPEHALFRSQSHRETDFHDTLAHFARLRDAHLETLVAWLERDSQNFSGYAVLIAHDWQPEQQSLAERIAQVLLPLSRPAFLYSQSRIDLLQHLSAAYAGTDLEAQLDQGVLEMFSSDSSDAKLRYFADRLHPAAVSHLLTWLSEVPRRELERMRQPTTGNGSEDGRSLALWTRLLTEYRDVLEGIDVWGPMLELIEASAHSGLQAHYKTALFQGLRQARTALGDHAGLKMILGGRDAAQEEMQLGSSFFVGADSPLRARLALLALKAAYGRPPVRDEHTLLIEGLTAASATLRFEALIVPIVLYEVGGYTGRLPQHEGLLYALLGDSNAQVRGQAAIALLRFELLSDTFVEGATLRRIEGMLAQDVPWVQVRILAALERTPELYWEPLDARIELLLSAAHRGVRDWAGKLLAKRQSHAADVGGEAAPT